MRNLNRLINDFRNQTYLTIWKHMNAMAVNYAVYSNRIKGFAPYLYNCDIYIYADSINMVVVCVDSNKHRQKQCYDETERQTGECTGQPECVRDSDNRGCYQQCV